MIYFRKRMGLRIETGGMPRMIGSGSDSDPMIHHFGKVFSSKGILPDQNKVAALKAAGLVHSATEVCSFLFFAVANADSQSLRHL